ncbi:MAG: EAL domain-containing protein [Arenimonas sp.]|nr:EAL domain-containing protein [Arenimonas sp.]
MGSLRRQSLLMTAVIFVICLAIGSMITYYVIERSMREFESRDAIQTQKRINILLNQQLINMSKQAADYAIWTATYDFMDKFDSDYITDSYSEEIFDNLDIDQAYLIRTDNTIAMAMFRANQITPGATGIRHIVDSKSTLLLNTILSHISNSKDTKFASFLSLNNRQYIYGVSEILTSERKGPSHGYLIFVRLIDKKRMSYLKLLAQQNFSLNQTITNERIVLDANRIESVKTLFNTNGDPVAMVQVNQPRPLKQLISTTRQIINLNALILTLVALLIVYLMFDRLVLRKIDLLVRNIFSIRQTGAIGHLLPTIGDHDIDRISSEINFMLEDLTHSHKKLVHDALHDSMTGLGNRKLLLQELEIACHEVINGKIERFSLMLMDLDAFKDINDMHGHLAGDYVISVIADRLRASKLRSILPIRLGGDEFAIIYRNYPLPSPEAQAALLLDAITQPIHWEGYILKVQASIGIVAIDNKIHAEDSATDLLRKADITMYASKNKGGNSYLLFHDEIEKALSDRKRLETELTLMIANEAFDVWMQPIIDTKSGKLFSFEALSRWFHPVLGAISPITFITLAEASQKISLFDRAVIRKTSALLFELRLQYPEIRICINISAATLIEDDICEFISAILDQHALPNNSIMLEITETMLATDKSRLETNINCLRAVGVQFLIDDFGTGYSSLSRLSDLPLDYVKIDKEFLNTLNAGDNQICKTIIKLAHSLDMQVIAEGVETELQHLRLQELGCDFVQGFKYAKPMNAANLSDYLLWLKANQLIN